MNKVHHLLIIVVVGISVTTEVDSVLIIASDDVPAIVDVLMVVGTNVGVALSSEFTIKIGRMKRMKLKH